jgi:hypothetical protein
MFHVERRLISHKMAHASTGSDREDKLAKRKLSPEQRENVRKEIRQYIAHKKKPAEILKTVAKKYGITTITARWYLKSVRGPQSPSAGRATSAKSSKRASTKKNRKPRAQTNGHTPRNGAVHRLVSSVQAIAHETFSRARQAKKLVPKWRAYIGKEFSLRKLESRVRRELRVISSKAQALHRKIRELTSR